MRVTLVFNFSNGCVFGDAFQEVDAVGITRSCVKHNFLVKNADDIAETVKKAFYIATTGRPGPVLIDITKDATIAEIEYEGYPQTIKMRSYQPEVQVDAEQIKKQLQSLKRLKNLLFIQVVAA